MCKESPRVDTRFRRARHGSVHMTSNEACNGFRRGEVRGEPLRSKLRKMCSERSMRVCACIRCRLTSALTRTTGIRAPHRARHRRWRGEASKPQQTLRRRNVATLVIQSSLLAFLSLSLISLSPFYTLPHLSTPHLYPTSSLTVLPPVPPLPLAPAFRNVRSPTPFLFIPPPLLPLLFHLLPSPTRPDSRPAAQAPRGGSPLRDGGQELACH